MSPPPPSRPWFLILAVAALVLALGAVGWSAWQRQQPNSFLTVINNSGEGVTELTVLGGKETFLGDRLPAGATASFAVRSESKSSWDIAGKWPDGAIFEQRTPLANGPLPHQAVFTLLPGRKFAAGGAEPGPPEK